MASYQAAPQQEEPAALHEVNQMHADARPGSQGEAEDATSWFRREWEVYQSVLAGDHLEHACLYASTLQLLAHLRRERARPLRLVDLGCGDAEYICRGFRQLAASESEECQPLLQAYMGVDLSAAALTLAKKHLAQSVPASTQCSLLVDDMLAWLQKRAQQAQQAQQQPQQQPPQQQQQQDQDQQCDVVVISFALHHLEVDHKLQVLRLARQLLGSCQGMLLLIDVFRKPDEPLDVYRARFAADVDETWCQLAVSTKQTVKSHVCSFDIPESPETYRELSRQAQFSEMEVVREGGKGFSKLVVFRA